MSGNHSQTREADDLKQTISDWLWKDSKMVGYAKYCTTLRIFWNDSIDTACAGKGFIFFNKKFIENLPEATRKTVFMHEVWHLILEHLDRYSGRHHSVANIAMDHVINLMLIDDGHSFEGLKGYYADPIYRGMSFEQVYNILIQKLKNDNNFEIDLNSHMTKEEIDKLIKEVEQTPLDELEDFANMNLQDLIEYGDDEGKYLRKLNKTSHKVFIKGATYQEILKDYIKEPEIETKRTYRRPSRRARPRSDLRLAGRRKQLKKDKALEHLYFALDVSGSITVQQATQFHDAVRTVKELLKPEKMTIIFFDTIIKYTLVLNKNDQYGNVKIRAGGGTCIKCVWKKVLDEKPTAVIMFTDMGFQMPNKPGDADVIWLTPVRPAQPPMYGKGYYLPEPI